MSSAGLGGGNQHGERSAAPLVRERIATARLPRCESLFPVIFGKGLAVIERLEGRHKIFGKGAVALTRRGNCRPPKVDIGGFIPYTAPVNITVQLRLFPSAEQADRFRDTMRRFNAACNAVAEVAFREQTANKFRLQKLVYEHLRTKHGIPADMAIRVMSSRAGGNSWAARSAESAASSSSTARS